MAIREDNNANQNSNSGNTQGQQETTMGAAFGNARNQQGQSERQPSLRFSDMGNLAHTPMGRNPQAEVLAKLTKETQATLETSFGKEFIAELLPLDMNNNSQLIVSALILAISHSARKDVVAYHTLILEGSTGPIPPRYESMGNENIEIVRTVADANDARMQNLVDETVARRFPNAKRLNAAACVVPRDFNTADAALVYGLVANAAYACATTLSIAAPNFQDLNLANASRDESLVVRPLFTNTQLTNAVGRPIRADIQIDTTASIKETNQAIQGLERVSQIASVAGYCDLVYAPLQAQNQGFYVNQPQPTQKYAVRFVMTDMQSKAVLTPAAQLFCFTTAMMLRDNNGWAPTFRPDQRRAGKFDMRDIGALNVELNLSQNPSGFGEIADTKSASFNDEAYSRLLNLGIRPGLIVTLHVPECGPSTWFNDMFSAASMGNQEAIAQILDACNTLTNGRFNNHFPQGAPICFNEDNRIHNGVYEDSDGNKCDLRNIDTLAIANIFGSKDPQQIRAWTDTFNNTAVPLAKRLADRKRIIQGVAPSAQFDGFSIPVTFTDAFVTALLASVAEMGLDLRALHSHNEMQSYERSSASWISQGLMSSGPTGVFNRGMGQTGSANYARSNNSFGGRW